MRLGFPRVAFHAVPFPADEVLERAASPRRAAAREEALHLKLLLVGQERSFPVCTSSKCASSVRRAISPLSIRVHNISRKAVQCAKHGAKLYDACATCVCCLKRLNHPASSKMAALCARVITILYFLHAAFGQAYPGGIYRAASCRSSGGACSLTCPAGAATSRRSPPSSGRRKIGYF